MKPRQPASIREDKVPIPTARHTPITGALTDKDNP